MAKEMIKSKRTKSEQIVAWDGRSITIHRPGVLGRRARVYRQLADRMWSISFSIPSFPSIDLGETTEDKEAAVRIATEFVEDGEWPDNGAFELLRKVHVAEQKLLGKLLNQLTRKVARNK